MQNNIHPAFFWIGLSSIPGVGRVTFRKLIHHTLSLSGILINLELKGLAKQLPGKYYMR